MLFAFLLTLAFSGSFPRDRQEFAYTLTAALLASAGSALCFMAPVMVHRMTFRLGGKERLVWVTHRLALVALSLLALAMLLSVWLVTAFLFTNMVGTIIVACLAVFIMLLWVALPAVLRMDELERERDSAQASDS